MDQVVRGGAAEEDTASASTPAAGTLLERAGVAQATLDKLLDRRAADYHPDVARQATETRPPKTGLPDLSALDLVPVGDLLVGPGTFMKRFGRPLEVWDSAGEHYVLVRGDNPLIHEVARRISAETHTWPPRPDAGLPRREVS